MVKKIAFIAISDSEGSVIMMLVSVEMISWHFFNDEISCYYFIVFEGLDDVLADIILVSMNTLHKKACFGKEAFTSKSTI